MNYWSLCIYCASQVKLRMKESHKKFIWKYHSSKKCDMLFLGTVPSYSCCFALHFKTSPSAITNSQFGILIKQHGLTGAIWTYCLKKLSFVFKSKADVSAHIFTLLWFYSRCQLHKSISPHPTDRKQHLSSFSYCNVLPAVSCCVFVLAEKHKVHFAFVLECDGRRYTMLAVFEQLS